jgi:hypothetical protein
MNASLPTRSSSRATHARRRTLARHYGQGVILVHAGNRVDLPGRDTPRFPASLVPIVRRRLARVLDDLRPAAVVSAAAAGADLIVLEEAIAAGIPIHLALPLSVEQFRLRAVEDLGEAWEQSFDRVLAAATEHGTVHIENRGDDEDWFTEGNETILERAEAVADGDSVYALVVRPHRGEAAPSTTDRFAESAAARGWPVIELGITP